MLALLSSVMRASSASVVSIIAILPHSGFGAVFVAAILPQAIEGRRPAQGWPLHGAPQKKPDPRSLFPPLSWGRWVAERSGANRRGESRARSAHHSPLRLPRI